MLLRLLLRPSFGALIPSFRALIPSLQPPTPTFSAARTFSSSFKCPATNTSNHTKENVRDLTTFLTLIGRNCIEHAPLFDNDLQKFLTTKTKQMKEMGIDTRTRRYLLRWIHKFQNNLEPLREHKLGVKKNGGQRKAKTVLAKRNAIKRKEEIVRLNEQERAAENRGERLF